MELINAAFSSVNIIPTTILIFCLLYWLIVIFGLIGIDTVDFDVETEVDAGVDADVDGSISSLNHILKFFNIHKLPFMVFLSLLAFPFWASSVLLNDFLGNESFLFSLVFLIPLFIGSLLVSKIFSTPFAWVFSKLDTKEEKVTVIGRIANVKHEMTVGRLGQVVCMIDMDEYLFSAKIKGDKVLKKGETCMIVDYVEDENYYLVEPYAVLG